MRPTHPWPVWPAPNSTAALKDVIPPNVPIMSTSKGIHVATEKLMYDVIPDALQRPQPTAFLSGPSFAKEMMQNFPTTVVIASTDTEVAKAIQLQLSQKTFRVYTTTDVVGLEIGARLPSLCMEGGTRADARGRLVRGLKPYRRCTEEPAGHRRGHRRGPRVRLQHDGGVGDARLLRDATAVRRHGRPP